MFLCFSQKCQQCQGSTPKSHTKGPHHFRWQVQMASPLTCSWFPIIYQSKTNCPINDVLQLVLFKIMMLKKQQLNCPTLVTRPWRILRSILRSAPQLLAKLGAGWLGVQPNNKDVGPICLNIMPGRAPERLLVDASPTSPRIINRHFSSTIFDHHRLWSSTISSLNNWTITITVS